jgi:hypothetical protein
VQIEVPVTAWGGRGKCTSNAKCSTLPGYNNFKFVHYTMPGEWSNHLAINGVADAYVDSLKFTVPNIGYGMTDNHEYISVESPTVRFLYYPVGSSSYTDESIPVSFTEYLPNASSYTAWTSGSVPFDEGSYSNWQYVSATSGSPVLNSAVSLSVQTRDNWATFGAGALLGIAGGALIGGIQEVVKDESEKRRPLRT